MCGIAGYIKIGNFSPYDHAFAVWFSQQLTEIAKRGIDAAGIVWVLEDRRQEDGDWYLSKVVERGDGFDFLAQWQAQKDLGKERGFIIIGCLINYRNIPVTESFGPNLTAEQIQPFMHEDLVVAHNGQLANDKQLAAKYGWERMSSAGDHDIDSYAFLQLYKNNTGWCDLSDLLALADGSWAISLLDAKNKILMLSRTFLGLDIAAVETNGNLYMAWGSTFLPRHELRLQDYSDAAPTDLLQNITIESFPSYSCAQYALGNFCQEFTARQLTNPAYLMRNLLKGGAVTTLNRQDLLPISKVAVVASGGLDSTVALTMACQQYQEVHVLHFQYGAKAEDPELEAINEIVNHLQLKHIDKDITIAYIDLSFLKKLGGSSLTEASKEITKGELGVEKAKEWVPARNTVMMAMAAAYCDRHELQGIMLGLNREESAVYCDNSTEFFNAFEQALDLGTKSRPKMLMPLAEMMKYHIVKKGLEIGAPMDLSWSCYDAQEHPTRWDAKANAYAKHIRCGNCGPCLMRRRAYAMNGRIDQVPYACEDPIANKIYDAVMDAQEV